jgi:hypothetical protein
MDKQFWVELSKNQYEIPGSQTLTELTQEIFSIHLGSADPELRDEIGYPVYANWLKQQRYSPVEIRAHVRELLANLDRGIGETGSDAVFLRAFSVLFLAEIVHNDNRYDFFEKADVEAILEKGIAYLGGEKDPRGFVPVKGWAHALAHTADLLMVLAKNRHLAAGELKRILAAISTKMFHAAGGIYVHGEDERLANAVIEVLRRNLLTTDEIKDWALTFIKENWRDAYMDERRNNAFQNTRNLLRSIYLTLKSDETELPKRNEIEGIFLEVLKELKPW